MKWKAMILELIAAHFATTNKEPTKLICSRPTMIALISNASSGECAFTAAGKTYMGLLIVVDDSCLTGEFHVEA